MEELPSQRPKAEGPAVTVEELVALGVTEKKANQTLKNLALCRKIAELKSMAEQLGGVPAAVGIKLFNLASNTKNPNAPPETLQIVVKLLCSGGIASTEQVDAAQSLLNSATEPSSQEFVETHCGVGITVSAQQISAAVEDLFVKHAAEVQAEGHAFKGSLLKHVCSLPGMQFASRKLVNEVVGAAFVSKFGAEDKAALKLKKKGDQKEANKKAALQKQEEEAAAAAAAAAGEEQVVTPWDVQAGEDGVDYDKLIRDFGCEYIYKEQIERIERITKMQPHRFLRRGIFFSQKELDVILDCAEKKEPFYLYTGRGPSSSSMHLGHLVPFLFTKYLQDAFNVPLVIQMTDDEKFLFKEDLEMDHVRTCLRENAKDIIALGFDPDTTFMFSDLDYITGGHGTSFYRNALEVQKRCNLNTAQKVFGFEGKHNIGQVSFASIQASPSFASSFPHIVPPSARFLIPCAIDQDPYFRVTRDIAPRMKEEKPALIHSKFFPAMTGAQSKMSSSTASLTTIFLTDQPQQIADKIKQYAFSGAPKTLAEHREKGANLEVDVAYQYLRFFMEDDDKLSYIGEQYSSGNMTTGEVKNELAVVLQQLVADFQQRRAQVSEVDVDYFMSACKFSSRQNSSNDVGSLEQYFSQHDLECKMAEAANHVARTRPADPMKAIADYFQQLSKSG